MNHFELEETEQRHRREIAEHTRSMIYSKLNVTGEDDTSIMASYGELLSADFPFPSFTRLWSSALQGRWVRPALRHSGSSSTI